MIHTLLKKNAPYFWIGGLLVLIYLLWLLCFWPGVLGPDGYAMLLQMHAEDLSFHSGKPMWWDFFCRLTYRPTLLIEVPIAALLLICAVIFSRILGRFWQLGLRKTCIWAFLFIASAPHMLLYMGSLYPDAAFAVATAGWIFELWYISRQRSLSFSSLLFLCFIFPIAIFFRTNGLILLLALIAPFLYLRYADRLKLAAVVALWLGVHIWQMVHYPMSQHGAVLPMVIHETVNFILPRPMNLLPLQYRVTPKTLAALERYSPLDHYIQYYDRDYWDTLAYWQNGPSIGRMEEKDKKIIIRQFFKYNLWNNIPAFLASRTNIFWVAALAKGAIHGYYNIDYYANKTESISLIRPFKMGPLPHLFNMMYEFSYQFRWLFWTPLLGIYLALTLCYRAFFKKDYLLFWITFPIILELGGVIFFSVAGEYRYLLPFFTLSGVLLGIRNLQKSEMVSLQMPSAPLSTK